ncbi:hypothetical protein BT69DRAFT_1291646 [Atractiella rhizophila]|nr:hypothetical protein BT69DRAFT_1291646 [Atractiella rhizophila]
MAVLIESTSVVQTKLNDYNIFVKYHPAAQAISQSKQFRSVYSGGNRGKMLGRKYEELKAAANEAGKEHLFLQAQNIKGASESSFHSFKVSHVQKAKREAQNGAFKMEASSDNAISFVNTLLTENCVRTKGMTHDQLHSLDDCQYRDENETYAKKLLKQLASNVLQQDFKEWPVAKFDIIFKGWSFYCEESDMADENWLKVLIEQLEQGNVILQEKPGRSRKKQWLEDSKVHTDTVLHSLYFCFHEVNDIELISYIGILQLN